MMMKKFLQEFNRELTDSEILNLLKRKYKAQKYHFQVGVGSIGTIIYTYVDGQVTEDAASRYLITYLIYKNSDWKKLVSKYEETVNSNRVSFHMDTEKWHNFNQNEAAHVRWIVKKGSCLAFVYGTDMVFTQFNNVKLFNKNDYLVTRFDPVKWESNKCKTTKEQDFI